jgi:hypothetical protein
LRRKVGSPTGDKAKFYTEEACLDALMRAAWNGLPLLPDRYHDDNTAPLKFLRITAGYPTISMPEDCVVFEGIELEQAEEEAPDKRIYLYWDLNQFRERRLSLQRSPGIQNDVVLICAVAKSLRVYPTQPVDLITNVHYYARIPHPDDYEDFFMCPVGPALEFVLTMAAADAKLGQQRDAEARALDAKLLEALQTIMGVDQRKVELKERGVLVE